MTEQSPVLELAPEHSSALAEPVKRRILVAVKQSSATGYPDPSIRSNTAFDWTLETICRTSPPNFRLFILHVQPLGEDGFNDMDQHFVSPEDFESIMQKHKIRGVHLLEHFVRCCHAKEIPCLAWIKKGNPKEVICSEVKRLHPDIFVLGSRVRGLINRALVGESTVSDYCLKHAKCPVIRIKQS